MRVSVSGKLTVYSTFKMGPLIHTCNRDVTPTDNIVTATQSCSVYKRHQHVVENLLK